MKCPCAPALGPGRGSGGRHSSLHVPLPPGLPSTQAGSAVRGSNHIWFLKTVTNASGRFSLNTHTHAQTCACTHAWAGMCSHTPARSFPWGRWEWGGVLWRPLHQSSGHWLAAGWRTLVERVRKATPPGKTTLTLTSSGAHTARMGFCLVTQSCLTLRHPMNCSSPGSSIPEIFQARILERVAMPSSRGSLNLHLLCLLHFRWILYSLSRGGRKDPLEKEMATHSSILAGAWLSKWRLA